MNGSIFDHIPPAVVGALIAFAGSVVIAFVAGYMKMRSRVFVVEATVEAFAQKIKHLEDRFDRHEERLDLKLDAIAKKIDGLCDSMNRQFLGCAQHRSKM